MRRAQCRDARRERPVALAMPLIAYQSPGLVCAAGTELDNRLAGVAQNWGVRQDQGVLTENEAGADAMYRKCLNG